MGVRGARRAVLLSCRALAAVSCPPRAQAWNAPYDVSYVDAWSLGCVALELALGGEWFTTRWLHLYQTQRDHEGLVVGLMAMRAVALSIVGEAMRTELGDFLARTLELSLRERLAPSRLLRHAWLSPRLA